MRLVGYDETPCFCSAQTSASERVVGYAWNPHASPPIASASANYPEGRREDPAAEGLPLSALRIQISSSNN